MTWGVSSFEVRADTESPIELLVGFSSWASGRVHSLYARHLPAEAREAIRNWLDQGDAEDAQRMGLPDPATDQIHGAEIRDVLRRHLAPVRAAIGEELHNNLVRDLQGVFDRAYFQPTGDNHHNAKACPYCRGAHAL